MWLREHARVYSAGSPVDTGEIALYKNYSLLLLLLLLGCFEKTNNYQVVMKRRPFTRLL